MDCRFGLRITSITCCAFIIHHQRTSESEQRIRLTARAFPANTSIADYQLLPRHHTGPCPTTYLPSNAQSLRTTILVLSRAQYAGLPDCRPAIDRRRFGWLFGGEFHKLCSLRGRSLFRPAEGGWQTGGIQGGFFVISMHGRPRLKN